MLSESNTLSLRHLPRVSTICCVLPVLCPPPATTWVGCQRQSYEWCLCIPLIPTFITMATPSILDSPKINGITSVSCFGNTSIFLNWYVTSSTVGDVVHHIKGCITQYHLGGGCVWTFICFSLCACVCVCARACMHARSVTWFLYLKTVYGADANEFQWLFFYFTNQSDSKINTFLTLLPCQALNEHPRWNSWSVTMNYHGLYELPWSTMVPWPWTTMIDHVF